MGLRFSSHLLPRLVLSPAPAPPSGLCGGVRRRRRARTGGGAGRGAAPRAGPGGRALAAGAAPRAPRSGRSPGRGPPILLRRGECDGRPQGCVCIPVFPGPGPPGPSGRVSVRGSVCAWGYRCFSESAPVSVHVRRVHVRESSGGILRAVAAHVRSMFEGGDAGGWVMVP